MSTTTAHEPHPAYVPRTLDLTELRKDLYAARETHGRGSWESHDAYQRLNQASHMVGRPLDGLQQRSPVETERFFAGTIQGPDGHVYWDGPGHGFVRNDGKTRKPLIWWWDHSGRERQSFASVTPACGDMGCINPEHAIAEDRRYRGRRYTDEQMLGRMQVIAAEYGTVTVYQWDFGLSLNPTSEMYVRRFGSWVGAWRSAGYDHIAHGHSSPNLCLKALRVARAVLNRWPSPWEFKTNQQVREALVKDDLPQDPRTVVRHLGEWDEALRKAGKR